jgi:hypothetical protein
MQVPAHQHVVGEQQVSQWLDASTDQRNAETTTWLESALCRVRKNLEEFDTAGVVDSEFTPAPAEDEMMKELDDIQRAAQKAIESSMSDKDYKGT